MAVTPSRFWTLCQYVATIPAIHATIVYPLGRGPLRPLYSHSFLSSIPIPQLNTSESRRIQPRIDITYFYLCIHCQRNVLSYTRAISPPISTCLHRIHNRLHNAACTLKIYDVYTPVSCHCTVIMTPKNYLGYGLFGHWTAIKVYTMKCSHGQPNYPPIKFLLFVLFTLSITVLQFLYGLYSSHTTSANVHCSPCPSATTLYFILNGPHS